jgi:hypothetical protein
VRRQSEYWYARSAERQGQKEEAAALYQKLAAAPYTDLYAQHAITRGAKRVENRTNPLKKSGPDWTELAEKNMPRELRLAYELTALAAMREAYLEVRRNARRENARFAEALLADVHHAAGNQVAMYLSLRRAWPQLATVEQDSTPVYFMRMYYPLKYGDRDRGARQGARPRPQLRARADPAGELLQPQSEVTRRSDGADAAHAAHGQGTRRASAHPLRRNAPRESRRQRQPRHVPPQDASEHVRRQHLPGHGGLQRRPGQRHEMAPRRAQKPTDELLESIPVSGNPHYVKRVTMLKSAYERLTL